MTIREKAIRLTAEKNISVHPDPESQTERWQEDQLTTKKV